MNTGGTLCSALFNSLHSASHLPILCSQCGLLPLASTHKPSSTTSLILRPGYFSPPLSLTHLNFHHLCRRCRGHCAPGHRSAAGAGHAAAATAQHGCHGRSCWGSRGVTQGAGVVTQGRLKQPSVCHAALPPLLADGARPRALPHVLITGCRGLCDARHGF